MKSLNKLLFLALIGLGLFISSCDNKDDAEPQGKYEEGILITNEGLFGSGNGSVSFYSFDKDTVAYEIFKAENNRPLGDVVQSLTRTDDKVLIAVNNSNKVEIVNSDDFKSIATVEVMQPRYIVVDNDKAYVSSWANGGKVYVIDLENNTVIDSVAVGSTPEEVLIENDKLYVANNGWGYEQTVSIIKLSDLSVIKSLNIDAYGPAQLVKDKNDMIWVLASGQVKYDQNYNVIGHEPSALVQINPSTDEISNHMWLFDEMHPTKMGINKAGDKIYVGGGWGFQGFYAVSITASTAPTSPLINQPNYGFVIDHENDVIFLLQESSTANGKLIRYNADGTKIKEYTVGIYPGDGQKRFPN
ncbi:MAG: hypothetical protein L3J74_09610 [Bacteroidales bacterium]|nr:hypothetical protein [Bacteroidales bacterium]